MILALLACAVSTRDPEPTAPRAAEARTCAKLPDVSWDAWGAGFFRTYCTACHSSVNTAARAGAPVGIDFDTESAVRTQAASVRRVVLETGTMPIGGGVHEDDLVLLEVFLKCGIAD